MFSLQMLFSLQNFFLFFFPSTVENVNNLFWQHGQTSPKKFERKTGNFSEQVFQCNWNDMTAESCILTAAEKCRALLFFLKLWIFNEILFLRISIEGKFYPSLVIEF